MRFSVEWLGEGISKSPELRATASTFAIEVADTNISAFVDRVANLAYGAPTIPAYIVAETFARNWWRITAGRDNMFSLRKARLGYALPDLVIKTDGVYARCIVEPYSYDNPPLSFFSSATDEYPIQKLESEMRGIIELVLEKLGRDGVPDSILAERWDDIIASINDDDELAFCEGAGALGVEPYTCTDAEAHAIDVVATRLDGDAYTEFLASQTTSTVHESLTWIENNAKQKKDATILEIPEVAEVQVAAQIRPAWDLGYSAAKKFRKHLGIKDSARFRSPHSVAKLFGNSAFEMGEGRAPRIRAAVYKDGKSRFVLADITAAHAKTFALVRAIGDHTIFKADEVNPITDSESYRQATGRAFAAQFLAPADSVHEAYKNGYSRDEIAASFGVSPEVVFWQLENAGRIAVAT